LLAVTDRALCYICPNKSFRIDGDKVVSVFLLEDGIGLERDAATAKQRLFRTGRWLVHP
jgi:hypothetical protein